MTERPKRAAQSPSHTKAGEASDDSRSDSAPVGGREPVKAKSGGSPSARKSEALQRLKAGQRVEVKFNGSKGESWYPATVVTRKGAAVSVSFDDGSKWELTSEHCWRPMQAPQQSPSTRRRESGGAGPGRSTSSTRAAASLSPANTEAGLIKSVREIFPGMSKDEIRTALAANAWMLESTVNYLLYRSPGKALAADGKGAKAQSDDEDEDDEEARELEKKQKEQSEDEARKQAERTQKQKERQEKAREQKRQREQEKEEKKKQRAEAMRTKREKEKEAAKKEKQDSDHKTPEKKPASSSDVKPEVPENGKSHGDSPKGRQSSSPRRPSRGSRAVKEDEEEAAKRQDEGPSRKRRKAEAPPPPPVNLDDPAQWKSTLDPKKNKTYYWHISLRTPQWEPPACWAKQQPAPQRTSLSPPPAAAAASATSESKADTGETETRGSAENKVEATEQGAPTDTPAEVAQVAAESEEKAPETQAAPMQVDGPAEPAQAAATEAPPQDTEPAPMAIDQPASDAVPATAAEAPPEELPEPAKPAEQGPQEPTVSQEPSKPQEEAEPAGPTETAGSPPTASAVEPSA